MGDDLRNVIASTLGLQRKISEGEGGGKVYYFLGGISLRNI